MIVERLRGTAARLAEKALSTPDDHLNVRVGSAWSIQEHVGHLIDLEPLWFARVDDLLAGAEELRPADMTNRKTYEANHNQRDIEDLLAEFTRARNRMIERLDALRIDQVVLSARHPRLDQPMRLIDLCWFVAEHDDHHLTIMTRLRQTLTAQDS